MDKKTILAIAMGSAIIGFAWTFISFELELSTVAGFIAWSSFFAAGGNGMNGVKKGLIANLSGVFWGVICGLAGDTLKNYLDFTTRTSLTNGAGAFGIIMQSQIPVLSVIPASFLGWSAFIASDMRIGLTIVSLICGSFAGFISEKITAIILCIMNIFDKSKTTVKDSM